jgi:pimeloyl-ACP methyl ester carboxylesterase
MSGALIDGLAARRQVIGVELQGHGHTEDIDRPFSYEAFGEDVAGVITELGIDRADIVGYSLGAGAAVRAAAQHPERIRKLAAVSIPFRRDGWFPEVLGAMDHISGAGFAHMKQTPLYTAYADVAPDPDAFATLMDRTGELQRMPYDWRDDVGALTARTLLVFADADSVSTTLIAEFYALLGGGVRDANWDGSARSQAQLAVVPGVTHYDIFQSERLLPSSTSSSSSCCARRDRSICRQRRISQQHHRAKDRRLGCLLTTTPSASIIAPARASGWCHSRDWDSGEHTHIEWRIALRGGRRVIDPRAAQSRWRRLRSYSQAPRAAMIMITPPTILTTLPCAVARIVNRLRPMPCRRHSRPCPSGCRLRPAPCRRRRRYGP